MSRDKAKHVSGVELVNAYILSVLLNATVTPVLEGGKGGGVGWLGCLIFTYLANTLSGLF